MSFNDKYPATDQIDERNYKLLQPLIYTNLKEEVKILVPPGFITDKIS